MSMSIVFLILGLAFIRAVSWGPRRWERGRRWGRPGGGAELAEKVAKLETRVGDLQEQLEQDRILLGRLEEERDFYRQLYPAAGGQPS